jgi:hypothetical protein
MHNSYIAKKKRTEISLYFLDGICFFHHSLLMRERERERERERWPSRIL